MLRIGGGDCGFGRCDCCGGGGRGGDCEEILERDRSGSFSSQLKKHVVCCVEDLFGEDVFEEFFDNLIFLF